MSGECPSEGPAPRLSPGALHDLARSALRAENWQGRAALRSETLQGKPGSKNEDPCHRAKILQRKLMWRLVERGRVGYARDRANHLNLARLESWAAEQQEQEELQVQMQLRQQQQQQRNSGSSPIFFVDWKQLGELQQEEERMLFRERDPREHLKPFNRPSSHTFLDRCLTQAGAAFDESNTDELDDSSHRMTTLQQILGRIARGTKEERERGREKDKEEDPHRPRMLNEQSAIDHFTKLAASQPRPATSSQPRSIAAAAPMLAVLFLAQGKVVLKEPLVGMMLVQRMTYGVKADVEEEVGGKVDDVKQIMERGDKVMSKLKGGHVVEVFGAGHSSLVVALKMVVYMSESHKDILMYPITAPSSSSEPPPRSKSKSSRNHGSGSSAQRWSMRLVLGRRTNASGYEVDCGPDLVSEDPGVLYDNDRRRRAAPTAAASKGPMMGTVVRKADGASVARQEAQGTHRQRMDLARGRQERDRDLALDMMIAACQDQNVYKLGFEGLGRVFLDFDDGGVPSPSYQPPGPVLEEMGSESSEYVDVQEHVDSPETSGQYQPLDDSDPDDAEYILEPGRVEGGGPVGVSQPSSAMEGASQSSSWNPGRRKINVIITAEETEEID